MPKKKSSRNGKGKLTKEQEKELAALPEPHTELGKIFIEARREFILSGQQPLTRKQIQREVLERRAGQFKP